MRKFKATRLLALCMAAVCLIGAVSALSFDLSGDGKTNVWDLQLAVNQNKTDAYADAVAEALGGKDELNPNAEGVYEIYSVTGLFNMAKHAKEGASFKLMNDIDMKGLDWAPVAGFKGTFDGNNKSISNMKITGYVEAGDGNSMGMFGDTINANSDTNRTVIKNLNLKDLQILVDENDPETKIRYIGGIVGTNRGDVQNCTVTCAITDNRSLLKQEIFVGALVGRNANRKVGDKNVPNGKITGANTLDALEYYDYEPVVGAKSPSDPYKGPTKVNSQMAMFFAELQEGSAKRNLGIAGYGGSGSIPTNLLIQDTTNSSKYDDPILQERRTAVAATMYEMCTVEWTPSQTMKYIRRTVDDPSTAAKPTSTYTAGNVIRGIPYNHGSSSMDRFLAYMDMNADGRWQTKTTLPTVAIYFTGTEGKAALNAAYEEYIAEGTTDSRKAKIMTEYPEIAYMTGKMPSGNQIGFNMYIGADCSSQATWAWRAVSASDKNCAGFAAPTSTSDMYISQQWITKSGIQPVNGFILEDPGDADGDGNSNTSGDKSIVVKNYTRANKDFYMETLSHVTKGDLLMDYIYEGGHTLMAMSDAVTILTYDGAVSLDKSYIITAEQGGSGGSRKGTTADGKSWTSSCCADEMNSFNKLYKEGSTEVDPGIFFPITCAALHEVNTPAATATCTMNGGKITSNFQIVSTTVGGETVYPQIQVSNFRPACTSLTVATAHPNVKAGDTVTVKLSNGQTYEFIY